MKRFLVIAASAFSLLAAGWMGLALFPALPNDLGGVESLDRQARRLRIPIADGDSLDGWFVPGQARAVVLLFHGYGRTHERAWRYGQFLSRAGYDLLAIDFRSSRMRGRKPTTLGHYELADACAALDWVRSEPSLRDHAIGVLGESLGGAVALALAASNPGVAALVVDSGFATGYLAIEDAFRLWARFPAWPAAPLARKVGRALTGHDPGRFDLRPAARRLASRPLFFIHGLEDRRVSPDQTLTLWRAAGGKHALWLIPGVGHNEGWAKRRVEYEARVTRFFDRTLLRSGNRS